MRSLFFRGFAPVIAFTPQHEFLVAIDSDGCAFDTMELKHKECFVPSFINHYELQGVSRVARETWEFVNLYSRSRGVNRFPALLETLDRLRVRDEVVRRAVDVMAPDSLRTWIKQETRLGNPALKTRIAETPDPALEQCLRWSQAVNDAVDTIVRNVGPFPGVHDCLQSISNVADCLVCSATPQAALQKEWAEHGIDRFVQQICGQESGTKKEILAGATKYSSDRVLMVGDAPGDHAAAIANQRLFFPINPGHEEASWRRFYEEGIPRFLSGTFRGEFQDMLLHDFHACLPEEPPWQRKAATSGTTKKTRTKSPAT